MEDKDLKKVLGSIAKGNGYNTAFGIWYKESNECIFTLSLQKSNYENTFYLNLKSFIKGAFDINYKIEKSLKNDTGDIFRRIPKEYDKYLNCEIDLSHEERINGLENLFKKFINPFSQKALEKGGILILAENGDVSLLPAVKEELEKLMK